MSVAFRSELNEYVIKLEAFFADEANDLNLQHAKVVRAELKKYKKKVQSHLKQFARRLTIKQCASYRLLPPRRPKCASAK